MSQKYVLATVGTADLYDGSGELIVSSKTLVNSGINMSVTEEEIRGGMLNGLLSTINHDSSMGLTLEDALFSLEYLALNVGGSIKVGENVMTMESITTTVANEITVSKTPQSILKFGAIGWYSIQGEDNWNKIAFNQVSKTALVPELPSGTKVCVKYAYEDANAESFVVSSAFIPAQCSVILTFPLFKASSSSEDMSTASKVGEVQVEVPNFKLSGSVDLSLTASGASTTSLSGKALTTFGGSNTCSGDDGYYATFKQVVFNKNEFADVKQITIVDSDIELAIGEKQEIEVIALFNGGIKTPKPIDNGKLVITSTNSEIARVVNGVVEALDSGSADIEIVVGSQYPNLKAVARVTVAEA